jgi:sec-independent protein translocase protein TatA
VFDFSPIQIVIVLVIALLVFGPKRLPEMGRSLGRGLREFKGSISGDVPARTVDDPHDALPDVDDLVAARQEAPAPTPEVAEAEAADAEAEAAGARRA